MRVAFYVEGDCYDVCSDPDCENCDIHEKPIELKENEKIYFDGDDNPAILDENNIKFIFM